MLEERLETKAAALKVLAAARRGCVEAKYRMGRLAEEQGNDPTLGSICSEEGEVLEMSSRTAMHWFHEAAMDGHATAQSCLAAYYDPQNGKAADEGIEPVG